MIISSEDRGTTRYTKGTYIFCAKSYISSSLSVSVQEKSYNSKFSIKSDTLTSFNVPKDDYLTFVFQSDFRNELGSLKINLVSEAEISKQKILDLYWAICDSSKKNKCFFSED